MAIVDDNEFTSRKDWDPMQYVQYGIPGRASDAGPKTEKAPFFAEAEPCESCGEPCEKREWNAEHEMWIGVNCSCSMPDQKMPECLYEVVMQAETAGELVRMVKNHRATCVVCGMRKAPGRETRKNQKREAA